MAGAAGTVAARSGGGQSASRDCSLRSKSLPAVQEAEILRLVHRTA